MSIGLRHWNRLGVIAACMLASCAESAESDDRSLGSTSTALTEAEARVEALTTRPSDTAIQADTRRQIAERLRLSIAKLEELEAKARALPNTQDAQRQLQAQRQRLTQRIREVERNTRAVAP